MLHTKLPIKISSLLYIIVFMIPLGFYSTYNSFDSIKEDSNILQQTGWLQGTLPFLSKNTLNNVTTKRLDSTLAKYEAWVTKNKNSEHYIGTQTLQKDMQEVQMCWDEIKNSPSHMTLSCSDKMKTLSVTIQEIIKSKQNKTINMFYLSLSLTMLVVLFSIYSLRLYMQYQIRKHAIHDHETNLYNQKYFNAQLHSLCARSQRHNDPFSVLFISLNGFTKKTYDKKTAEMLLKQIGEIITIATRDSDVACRYDENHFVILMPFTTSENGYVLEKRIKEVLIQQQFNVEPKLSFGYATTQYDINESEKEFIKRAQGALQK